MENSSGESNLNQPQGRAPLVSENLFKNFLNRPGTLITAITITVLGIVFVVGGYLFNIRKNQPADNYSQQPILNNNQKTNVSPQKSKLPSFLYYSYPPFLYFSQDGGLTAGYEWNGDFTTRIYHYDPNTKTKKEILSLPTTLNLSLQDGKISPDGKKLAYILNDENFPQSRTKRKSELWLVDADGSNNTLIYRDDKQNTNHISNLYWSPDTNYLIFSSGYLGQIYKVSITDKKLEKVNLPLQARIAGWFSNNKLGFEITDTEGCTGDCYHIKIKTFLSNPDATGQEEVFSPKEKELAGYYWLYDGNGIITEQLHGKRFYYYDFIKRSETEISNIPQNIPQIRVFATYPKSSAVLLTANDGGDTLYKLDFSSAPMKYSSIKVIQEETNRPREISQMAISNDEKYYLLRKSIPASGMDIFIEIVTNEGLTIDKIGPQNDISILGFVSN